ncbi:putative phenol 2 [Diplodia seriata]|uniref:Putative phenol 2 n=1 Tax=Diplodia seriata TaxID=420778 RepID=A0A0G2EAQ9_9PEZI|nr:putative phenol 2 [Diplodia seriata]
MVQHTPVLICGAGSAGLSAATWLARYKVPFTLLERRRGPLRTGQADGVQCRTVEVFESFGIAEELLKEAVVRKSLGIQMVGDSSDTIWGVMDVYPQTDFPDIRKKAIIRSDAGSLIIIPREGGSLVRFYIEIPQGVAAKDVKLADLHEAARRVFKPYSMEFAETAWWSAYAIGQRLADRFSQSGRVFLTGDACHTHSPKAGQGMNVSLQDGYNIGWKLGSALTGQVHHSIIDTYVSERQKVAADLIAFDTSFARLFKTGDNAPKPEYVSEQFIKAGRYMAGLTARYDDSTIIDSKGSAEHLAKNVTVGMRFPSAQVVSSQTSSEDHMGW